MTSTSYINKTKFAVDTFDQMCGETDVSRATKKWSQAYHYSMINNMLVNSYATYLCNMRRFKPEESILTRFKFNLSIALALTRDLKEYRYYNSGTISHELKSKLKDNLKIDDGQVSSLNVQL